MQRLIVGHVPLRELARLACLGKKLRSAYEDRTGDRDAAVAKLLESHFTAEFREGLSPADRALPNDLVVEPPVRARPFADEYKMYLVDHAYALKTSQRQMGTPCKKACRILRHTYTS